MDPDEALTRAWHLGEDEEGWSDAVMAEAELLLPVLIEAGYAETEGDTWTFTPEGVARAMELDREKIGVVDIPSGDDDPPEILLRLSELSTDKRYDEALTLADEILARYGKSSSSSEQGYAAWALSIKAFTLLSMGQEAEALAAYWAVTKYFTRGESESTDRLINQAEAQARALRRSPYG